jgi:hypothetical protein
MVRSRRKFASREAAREGNEGGSTVIARARSEGRQHRDQVRRASLRHAILYVMGFSLGLLQNGADMGVLTRDLRMSSITYKLLYICNARCPYPVQIFSRLYTHTR